MIRQTRIRELSHSLSECCAGLEMPKSTGQDSVACGSHRRGWRASHHEYFVVRYALLGPIMDKYNTFVSHMDYLQYTYGKCLTH